ncbi:MAG TPA: TetR/AcrR family transcriptional regulator [Solirubrobacteraceae bacterium]|jgi:AcrR family transcriptional regulator|nr:TetR/AcrR family transcriptional regulator [Solirubrobacteraceae bacterium]
MRVLASDLTTYARVRNAALEGFARDGVAGTSIRDVAKAAEVSPGLVQHHFSNKAALIEAVNDYVIDIATNAFSRPPDNDSPADIQQQLGDRVTALVSEHPTALRYVARSAADGDETALELFDTFLTISRAQWQAVADQDLLRPDTDIAWAALHAVVINLGTILLTDAIDRHLPEPFFTPEQLQRWNTASSALFREGIYRTPSTPESDC